MPGIRRCAVVAVISLSMLAVPLTVIAAGADSAAAAATNGSLIEYTLQPGGWGAVNVTPNGGIPVVGDGVPFVDPLTVFQNAYATSSGGHLTEYTRFPAGNWLTADITAAANGPAVEPSPQPFTDPLTGFQNAYATSTAGHLIEFTRLPPGNWIAADLTLAAHGPSITGSPLPFTDPLTGFQNAYATSTAGHLVEFTRLPLGNWTALDISTTFALPTIASDPAPFAVGGAQIAFGATGDGHLVEYARTATGGWAASDLTQAANGPTVTGDPAPIIDPLTHLLNVYDSQPPSDPIAPRVPGASSYAFGRAGTAGFTLIDTATGTIYTGGDADTQIRTASVIKVPIAMTLVARANAQGRGLTQNELSLLHSMITQSDNDAATALWNAVGGGSAVIGEMDALGATDTQADPGGAWGFTETTSRDLAVVLAQLARGVLGASGTNTILSLMHQVIASEAWGIGAALPGSAIKNGWYPDANDWRVNCLGIAGGTRYALAVMTEYPIGLGQGYGEVTCQSIAAQLLPNLTGASAAAQAAPQARHGAGHVPALSGVGMTVDGG